jgi:hypothetical protein
METSNKLIGEQLSLWTSSVVDTRVNRLAQQDTEKAQTTQDTYGHTCEQPLANYDRSTRSWRTLEGISLWGDYKSLESLPKSGMTRNGVLYQQEDWVPAINVSGSSLWPTPRAAQAESRNHTVYVRESGKPQNLENRIAQREPSAIGGKLNPMWVEWLMGFPTGWTDLED